MMDKTEANILVFDWGDTLMKVFPEYDGAMVDWPQVEAVAGVPETLASLAGAHRMFVGTNAANSSAEQVHAALRRAGIGQYIEQVFTVHELDNRKPSPDFFMALEGKLGVSRKQMVMVGDEYAADMTGACQAGWKTIWLNPGKLAAPGLYPLQSTELSEFSSLPAALQRLTLPDTQTCQVWLAQAGAAASLIAHVQAVAAAAYQMAVWLRASGEEVDVILTHRGGLLHDLAKLTPQLTGQPHLNHGERAAEMLLQRGQPALAEIARRHIMDALLNAPRQPETPEQQLVYFADKIIEGSSVVEFEDRLVALQQRYPDHSEEFARVTPSVKELREQLCQRMNIPVSELTRRLRQAFHSR